MWVYDCGIGVIREGNGTPLQYSCLENPMDRGDWWAAVHGVAKSRTRLSDFTFTFHFHALEKEMATHSSVLAWGIPGMGEPGGLPFMGSHRVRHDWSDLAAAAAVYRYKMTYYFCDTPWLGLCFPDQTFAFKELQSSWRNSKFSVDSGVGWKEVRTPGLEFQFCCLLALCL